MRNLILFGLIVIVLINCTTEDSIQPITVEQYMTEYKSLVNKNLQKKNALTDSMKLKSEYFDDHNGKMRINRNGIEVYSEAQIEAHDKMFQRWNYINHLEHNDFVYAIYFTIMGMDDMSWQVVRFKEDHWHNQKELPLENKSPLSKYLEFSKSEFEEIGRNTIIYNYDEGETNIENGRIFIKNNYLVFERGNLMHSLYDTKNEELVINEISPWYYAKQSSDSKTVTKESLNKWIKNNLHDKIAQKINGN